MRVAIANVQVPYHRGGAEALAEGLRAAVAARGHEVEIITLPFRFHPAPQVARAMEQWATEDFDSLSLYEPERVICLRFPAYAVRHHAKSLWLLHQHRAAYELFDGTPTSGVDAPLREAIHAFDRRYLPEIPRRYTIARRVSERLLANTGAASEALYHPPPMARDHYPGRADPYVFFPSRIEQAKRQDLVVRAMASVPQGIHAVFAGEGGQLGVVRELAQSLGVADRVRFVGRVSREEMLALYAHASAVVFTPLDEDYGYVTLEAMLSAKPVVTCRDSGGPLEFVVDGETGHVAEATPEAVARAIGQLLADPARAQRMGRAGRAHYDTLVRGWDHVVDVLLG